jgi:hypothetical protein
VEFQSKNFERFLISQLDTRIVAGHFYRFRVFIAFKIAIFDGLFVDDYWSNTNLATTLVLLVASVAVAARRHYWVGVMILLAHNAARLIETFPYTINHHFFETFLLLALLLFPAPEPPRDPGGTDSLLPNVDGLCSRVIQFGFLSVFFYSGVQKIFHGRYLNGEMFAYYAMFERHPLATSQRWILDWFQTDLGQQFAFPQTWHGVGGTIDFDIPLGAVIWFITLGWLTVLGECLLPILVCFQRTRRAALLALLVFLTIIAITSQEIGFGFTAAACLLLFWPGISRWSYLLLFMFELAYCCLFLTRQL